KARMKALAPYINVGQSRKEVEKVLGPSWCMNFHGTGFCHVYYGDLGKPGLAIEYYPDGEVCTIEYRDRDRKCFVLRTDDPITWPKTITGKNATLRRKRN